MENLIGDLKRFELAVFGAIGIVGAGVWAVYFYRRHRRSGEELAA